MSSTTETSFGARLGRAKTFNAHLLSFTDYVPISLETRQPEFEDLITNIDANTILYNETHSNFSLAIENRHKVFNKNADSIVKKLSPIGSYIKGKFGKESKQAKDINTFILKIRGEKTTKLKKDAEGEFVSQSEKSFNSIIQHFSSTIDTLNSYGTEYTPTNPKIEIAELTTLLNTSRNVNLEVANKYRLYKPTKDLRIAQFEELNIRSQNIKNAVKSQYGINSNQYNLIKGLKI